MNEEKVGFVVTDAYKLFLTKTYTHLDAFVESLGKLLACPITIENKHHHLLAYSEHGEGTDSARISTIIGRKVPDNLIHRFWKDGVMTALNQSAEPLLIAGIEEFGLGKRVALSIRDGSNGVIGYIWISETTRTLTVFEQQWLKKVAVKASTYFSMYDREQLAPTKEEKLWKVMTNTYSPTDLPASLMDQTNEKCMLMIDLHRKTEHLMKVEQLLQPLAPLYMFDGRYFIALVAHASIADPLKTIQTAMPSNLSIACGNPDRSLEGMAKSYEQAKEMVSLKNRFKEELNSLLFYYQAGAMRYVGPYEEKAYVSSKHPAIEQLKRYDQQNQTNLLKTLDEYLKNDSHLVTTAKALHIHTNSLQYRIKRITEITNIRLKDPNERTGLYLDLRGEH
ncbi:PucR family transcriptional regulator [Bacillus sp. C1-1]|nr:PucR family transcriptional regulator [Bacillus sp. C1-1]